jgi:hypothetical protein
VALELVLLVYASKKYDQTDSCAQKCLPRVTKTVMYMVKIFLGQVQAIKQSFGPYHERHRCLNQDPGSLW